MDNDIGHHEAGATVAPCLLEQISLGYPMTISRHQIESIEFVDMTWLDLICWVGWLVTITRSEQPDWRAVSQAIRDNPSVDINATSSAIKVVLDIEKKNQVSRGRRKR